MDPSWNPSSDLQAIDRAYRLGSKRDVNVYRLISIGLIFSLPAYWREQISNRSYPFNALSSAVKQEQSSRCCLGAQSIVLEAVLLLLVCKVWIASQIIVCCVIS